MYDEEFYDSEKEWFSKPHEIVLTKIQIQHAFEYFKRKYKLRGWKLRIAKTGICHWEKKLIVSSKYLSSLLHELGHAISNTGHNKMHKKIMLKLYREWDRISP